MRVSREIFGCLIRVRICHSNCTGDGALREFKKLNITNDSFNAAVNAGLSRWVSMCIPFFAEP